MPNDWRARHPSKGSETSVSSGVVRLGLDDEHADASANSEIGSALSEVSQVLKPGGTAAIGVWGGPDIEDYSDKDLQRGKPPRFFSRRSDKRWIAMLAEIGGAEVFETWGSNEDFFYQFAVVRREE